MNIARIRVHVLPILIGWIQVAKFNVRMDAYLESICGKPNLKALLIRSY